MAKFYHFTTDRALEGMLEIGRPAHLRGIMQDFHDLEHITTLDANQINNVKKKLETSETTWIEGHHIRGLWPSKRFAVSTGKENDPLINRSVIEGVCEPMPKGWVDEKSNLLLGLFHDIISSNRLKKLILLEVETTDKDKACVVDWALVHYDSSKGEKAGDGTDRYWNSRVPLDKYTGNEGFKWPVVVCWNPIPPERIKVMVEVDLKPEMGGREAYEAYKEQLDKMQNISQHGNGNQWQNSLGKRSGFAPEK